MNKREQALCEGLLTNEEETERWAKYEAEHKQAYENLTNFSKKLNVPVMVPIGTKALISGKLIHTNETFISHYGKLFSNCSAYQAGEICKYRIKMAKERLDKLQEERDMFQNKLEKPYLNGVLPSLDEREIIEVYDEEKEKLWREEHRKKVRYQKLKEKEDRNILNEKNDNEIFGMLDDYEIMDELEEELDGLNVNDSDIIQKLISGEIQVHEKKRIAHNHDVIFGDQEKELNITDGKFIEFPILNRLYKKYNTSEKLHEVVDFTNNNISNTDLEIIDNDLNSSNCTELPEEILQMEKEMINMSHYKKIKYLNRKIKEYEKNIDRIKIKHGYHLNEKMNKLEILDYIYDHLQFLEDESANSDLENTAVNNFISNSKNKKKKISFAAHDDIQIINKDEKVSEMLKNSKKEDYKRDVIKLDYDFQQNRKEDLNLEQKEKIVDKKKLIQDKVENNIRYVQENQNRSDFDLVGKILESVSPKTLKIKFKHSPQLPLPLNESSVINQTNNLINSPSDIYKLLCEPKDCYELTSPQNNIDKNEYAYEDIRTKFSNPLCAINEKKKPILKNKEVVNNEIRLNKSKKIKPKRLENASLTAFDMVMGDIVEKTFTEPDPLPNEQFVDSHTPKKRISRFKQIRNETIKANINT